MTTLKVKPLRILDTGLHPAQWNIAMTAALVELHAAGAIPDTVRFHRYAPCVLLGRSQSAASAMDDAYCRRNCIEGVHRITGGGAVFMSPRMLAWDVVIDRAACGGELDAATRVICTGVAAGLARLGAEARYRPPNDIAIGGRKVSGSSGYTEGGSVVLQGTVLIEDESEVMAGALRIPTESLRAGVTCMAEVLGAAPSMAVLIEEISSAVCGSLGRHVVNTEPVLEEIERCRALMEELFETPAEHRGATG